MLKFKGDAIGVKRLHPSKKEKSSKKKHKREKDDESRNSIRMIDGKNDMTRGIGDASTWDRNSGTGKVVCSGLTVHGNGTRFQDELGPGDVIVFIIDGEELFRVVSLIVSQTDLCINKRLNNNEGEELKFEFLKKPKDKKKEYESERKKEEKKKEELKLAAGTYAGEGNVFTYRERKSGPNGSGGYKLVSVTATEALDREDLLIMRTKKKGDRYCN